MSSIFINELASSGDIISFWLEIFSILKYTRAFDYSLHKINFICNDPEKSLTIFFGNDGGLYLKSILSTFCGFAHIGKKKTLIYIFYFLFSPI